MSARSRCQRAIVGLLLLGPVCVPAAASRPVPLQVTLGTLEPPDCGSTCARLDRLSRSSKMRAQAEGGSGDEAELEFVYLGPTEEVAPLASGRVRRQLGLKLRAKDSCNVLYVMWRIEPGPDLVVSLKSNPGKTRHAECGSAGYRTIRPRHRGQVPRLQVGARHVMRARLEGNALRAWIDGDLAWEGEVSGLDFDGPVGVRSDNVRFAFSLRTPDPSPPR